VIDLDAAMGKGNNLDLIKPLLRKAQCRVGGGIRTPEQAKELVSLGAQKIILGSSAFRRGDRKGTEAAGGEFAVNTAFLEGVIQKIGRERIIAAVDAKQDGEGSYKILVDGWKTLTPLDLVEAATSAEPYVSELLFTCVDREGGMTGIDLNPVEKLRSTVSCAVTVAGGVSTIEEIESLAARNCDVQLGMALYTGKINPADAFIASLNWKKAAGNAPALLPVIAQAPDGQVLMTGYTGREALTETFRRGRLCFHSRSRNRLWMKGETSGNTLKLLRLRADCDRDAILATVDPGGPTCHTGAYTCFDTGRRYTWEYLQDIIAERFRNNAPGSYTATLDDPLVREKVREEAEELCTAKTHDETVWEAADLLYFTTALITRAGVKVEEILDELDRRHKK
jgi:phosphoribosyl-ATP pyrophosphohydrolase/phosphoribosyl-AMP cyclohydrolase